MVKREKLDSRLEAEGAEFLVLGHLLIEGISCFKAYVNFPGYDLVAVNADESKTARIQVKSRYATDYSKGFPIKNFDCDFVVMVALNRGYRYRKKATSEDSGVRDPVFYVFPVAVVKTAWRPDDAWKKVRMNDIPDLDSYQSNWGLIGDFLK